METRTRWSMQELSSGVLPFFSRIEKILKSRFEIEAYLHFDLPDRLPLLSEQMKDLFFPSRVVGKKQCLFFPIVANQNSVYWLEIRRNKALALNEIQEIHDFIEQIIAPSIELQVKQQSLVREQQLIEENSSPSKLVKMSDYSTTQTKKSSFQEMFSPQLRSVRTTRKSPTHLFIEACSLADVTRIAVELHESSNRLALVPFKDLSSNMSISTLGAVTVFIRDISKLSGDDQREICRYLNQPLSADSPLFIFGSVLSLGDLLEQKWISTELSQALSRSRLYLQKPVPTYDRASFKRLVDNFFAE